MTHTDQDMDELLQQWGAAQRNAVPSGAPYLLDRRHPESRRHPWRDRWTVLAAVAAVVIIAVSVLLVTRSADTHSAHRPSAGNAPNTSSQGTGIVTDSPGSGILLNHPRAWVFTVSQAGEVSRGPSKELGYLTNQPTKPECGTQTITNGTEITCSRPVSSLLRSGVFITITAVLLDPAPITHPTQQISGIPARVTRTTDPGQSCPTGTALAVTAEIGARTPRGNGYIIDACLAAPTTATNAAVIRMLDTAVFP